MIKTHKPRGHFWSCPSLFQQSKEIRNLSFDDFTPPTARVIAPDSDDELQPRQRAAKRRRVEKLADEFLSGQPLVISCVRPHPSTLKGAVEGNERARTAARYALPVAELPDDDGELWADIDDLFDSPMEGANAPEASKQSKAQQKAVTTTVETMTEDHASSACKQVRHVKAVKISLDPSSGAVKQAAALRARRLQRAATGALRLPEGASSDVINESDNTEPHSEPSTTARSRQTSGRKSRGTEWLLRRQTTLYELSADESLDELNRSGLNTPSRPSQIPVQVRLSDESGPELAAEGASPDSSAGDTCTAAKIAEAPERPRGRISLGAYQEDWDISAGAPDRKIHDANDAPEDEASLIRGSYRTAPEISRIESGPETAVPQEAPEGNSQIQLLRRQGIHVAPPRTWTSTNERSPSKPSSSPVKDVELEKPSQESAPQAVKPQKGKRAKSAGSWTVQPAEAESRRRSAPTATQDPEILPPDEHYDGGPMKGYTVAQTKETDGTPFMFRKRTASRAGGMGSRESTVATRSRKQRRPMGFLSSEDGPLKKSGSMGADAQPVSAEAPILDVSFGNDSFAPKLNLALTDEHLNAVLPGEPKSACRSSVIKRAIRRELEDSGAQISRVDGEPASSQVEVLAEARALSFSALNNPPVGSHGGDVENDDSQEPATEVAQTQWPGTQALLHQAHADFFQSPEKQSNPHGHDAPSMLESSKADADPAPPSAHREPLRVLSQEAAPPLPSTQAMVEAWSPWSAVKKPKGITARVATPSPTILNARKPSTLASRSVVVSDDDRRRSSLRFSTSTTESPSMQLPFSVTKAACQETELKQSVSFSPLTRDSPSTHLPVSVSEGAAQDHKTLPSSADRTATPRSILRRIRGSQQSIPEGEMSLAWDPTIVMLASAPAVLDASTESDGGAFASSVQYAQRPLFRDDSNVEETVDELTLTVLGLGEFEGLS